MAKDEVEMNTDRRTAIVAGILFIVATAASLWGSSFIAPVLSAPDYLAAMAENGTAIMVGALLSFVAAATSAGIAISLYPVLRRYNEGLALGSVGYRLIEGVFYTVGIICLLSLYALSRELANVVGQDPSYFKTLGHVLLTTRDLANFVFGVMAFCIGACLYYCVFYRSKLIPRWLSVWGLVAILLLLAAVLITLLDGEPYSISGTLVFLALPIALQEMVLAVWLIAKGFDPSAIGSGAAKAGPNRIQ